MKKFRDKYGYENLNNSLFKYDEYIISNEKGNINTLNEHLTTFNGTDIKLLQKLSSMYRGWSDSEINESKKNIKDYLVETYGNTYKNWDGNQNPTINQIRNYKEYSEFKSSKFKVDRSPEYEYGQIKNLYFEFVE